MTNPCDTSSVYNIPAGVPFADALAHGLLREANNNPVALGRMMVFLPTQRFARALKDSFLKLAQGRALLLPRIFVIGSFDEDTLIGLLSAIDSDFIDQLPPAIDPLFRQGLLAQLIQKVPDRSDTMTQSMQLAGALGRLMDQIYTEGLDLKNLADLVPEEFSEHWQITLDFLKILSEAWPEILQEQGVIDAANRRDLMIRRLTYLWQNNPPSDRIIAAGSTGSIPATAEFLSCVSSLPNGAIILPGLDAELSSDEWDNLDRSHPQGGFKKLLSFLNCTYENVKPWNFDGLICDYDLLSARQLLMRRVMAEDHGSAAWRNSIQDDSDVTALQKGLENVSLYELDTPQDEAILIALKLREIAEDETKTGILVTPDRNLVRRVSALCTRWGIALDDSAGDMVEKSSLAIFLRSLSQFMMNPFDPVFLLNVLKHPLCFSQMAGTDKSELLCELEKRALRSGRDFPSQDLSFRFFVDDWIGVSGSDACQAFKKCMADIYEYINSVSYAVHSAELKDLIACHTILFQTFHSGVFSGSFDSGNADAEDERHEFDVFLLFLSLTKLDVLFKSISIDEYVHLFDIALSGAVIRQPFGVHPRLRVLGQMEARSMHSDVVILAGLNEGVWPDADTVDPWMSRSMQQEFGLPTSEQSLSLSSHDFVQGFCQGHVIITRSTRMGSDISVPSRWLSKLGVLADIANLDMKKFHDTDLKKWVKLFSAKDSDIQFNRPVVSPPVDVRPRRLSVTDIDKLIQDPYGIYAKHILKVRKIPAFSENQEARLRGIIIHNSLEEFHKKHGSDLPENADEILLNLAQEEFKKSYGDDPIWMFWQHQFLDAFKAYLKHEKKWKNNFSIARLEGNGEINIPGDGYNFELNCRLDRLDLLKSDKTKGAIIDYKTSATFRKKDISDLRSAQLPLEALIVQRGGLKNLQNITLDYMGYWIVKSGSSRMEEIAIEGDVCQNISDEASDRLMDLLDHYLKDLGEYVCLPNAMNPPRYNDYMHLERIQEWSDDALVDE